MIGEKKTNLFFKTVLSNCTCLVLVLHLHLSLSMSIECERVLMAMPQEALSHLSQMFVTESNSDGLSIERFIPIINSILPPAMQASLRDLRELFAQIDVDGSGTVSWQEFSDFCVEAGFVASEGERIKPASTEYAQRFEFKDRAVRLPSVESMISFVVADLQILAVCDARRPRLKMYLVSSPPQGKQHQEEGEEEEKKENSEDDECDTSDDSDGKEEQEKQKEKQEGMNGNEEDKNQGKKTRKKQRKHVTPETDEETLARTSGSVSGNVYLLGEIVGHPPTTYLERSRGDDVIEEGGFLTSLWMESLNVVACSRSCLSISFWNIHSLHEKPPRFSPMLVSSTLNTPLGPQHCLAWHDASRSLFAAGDRSLRVTRYHVEVETVGQRRMKCTQLASYVAHSQTITQLLVLDHPKHPLLASSSMDGFVHLWYLYGMKENQYQSSRPPLVRVYCFYLSLLFHNCCCFIRRRALHICVCEIGQ